MGGTFFYFYASPLATNRAGGGRGGTYGVCTRRHRHLPAVLRARVVRAAVEYGWSPSQEREAFYRLEGIDTPLITNTTGRSIKESTLYDDTPFSWEDTQ